MFELLLLNIQTMGLSKDETLIVHIEQQPNTKQTKTGDVIKLLQTFLGRPLSR